MEIIVAIIIILFVMAVLFGKEAQKKKEVDDVLRREKRREVNKIRFIEEFNESFPDAIDDLEPKFIFVDVETTDLPPQYQYIPDKEEIQYYPHIVQVSSLVLNVKGELIASYTSIIKPTDEHAFFNPSAVEIHGITKTKAISEGESFVFFIDFLKQYYRRSSFLIAHNIEFDNLMIRTEARRYKKTVPNFRKYCTMKGTYERVGIPNPYGGRKLYKYPTLQELLVCAYFDNDQQIRPELTFHTAEFDCRVCALCFFKLDLYQDISWKDDRSQD